MITVHNGDGDDDDESANAAARTYLAFLHCNEVVNVKEQDRLIASELDCAPGEIAKGHDDAEARASVILCIAVADCVERATEGVYWGRKIFARSCFTRP